MRSHVVPIFLIAFGFPCREAPAQESPIQYEISVDIQRRPYALGEPVKVRCKWTNRSDRPILASLWRGPLAGVASSGLDEKAATDFTVSRQTSNGEERLPYHGVFACGGPGVYIQLGPGHNHEARYVINQFLYPSYDLLTPGTYTIRSAYLGHLIMPDGERREVTVPAAPATFEVRALSDQELADERDRDPVDQKQKISILSAHRDNAAVPMLASLLQVTGEDLRSEAMHALSRIGTPDAVHVLGRALTRQTDRNVKCDLAGALGKSGSKLAIPYLNGLLSDTTWVEAGGIGCRKRFFIVRNAAVKALQQLGENTTAVIEEKY